MKSFVIGPNNYCKENLDNLYIKENNHFPKANVEFFEKHQNSFFKNTFVFIWVNAQEIRIFFRFSYKIPCKGSYISIMLKIISGTLLINQRSIKTQSSIVSVVSIFLSHGKSVLLKRHMRFNTNFDCQQVTIDISASCFCVCMRVSVFLK